MKHVFDCKRGGDETEKYDRVRVEVAAEGFVPLLKLVEVSTGAPLADWEERYSDEDALTIKVGR